MLRRTISYRRFCNYSQLTHIDHDSTPKMVDVSHKIETPRIAVAQAVVILPTHVRDSLMLDTNATEIFAKKGPVFTSAIIAGVMASKKTSSLIPFCHPISLEDCNIKINFDKELQNNIIINCSVKTTYKTGVEMEALVGATSAALCVYDMLKAVSHEITISDVKLIEKSGGKRDFKRLL
eukprot:gene14210-19066_t